MKALLLVVLFALSFSHAACKGAGPAPAKSAIAEALAQLDVFILDVRSPGEYAGGHVDGAINVPVDEIDRIEAILAEKDRQIIVHCAAGVRSARAVSRLKEMGYTKILDAQTPKAVANAMGTELVR